MTGPLQSPKPPANPDDGSTTGEHDAIATVAYVQRKAAEAVTTAKKDDRRSETRQTVGAVVFAVGIIFGAWRVVLSEAKAQTDAGVTPLVQRVATLEQGQAQQRADTHELQVDIRERYKVVQTGRRSERRSPDKIQRPPPSRET